MAEVTSQEAVRAAAREFDALGDESFLHEYDSGPASDRAVVADGRSYPARALIGAEHGHQHPDIGRLSDSDFDGPAETAAKARELGFEVRELGDDHEG